MILLGAGVNAIAVVMGVVLGIIFKRWITEELNRFLMQGLGICIIYVGYRGSLTGENAIIAILSMVIGGVIGHKIDFDKRLERLGDKIQMKLHTGDTESSFAAGFVNCTLLVCIGAMAIVGSMQSGMSGNHEILFSKSMIDFFAALVMAATMGWGVAMAAAPLFLYEGVLSLSAKVVSPYLTTGTINEMSCVGSLLIIMIGLNTMKLTNIKVANFILVPFLPILLVNILLFV